MNPSARSQLQGTVACITEKQGMAEVMVASCSSRIA
jgi:hypothetical protein